MHGTFWKFPKNFTATSNNGIRPRSNYLKVIGDFCRWQDKIVLGCDDTAKAEFLNIRKAKGEIAAPQSQSNLWFIDPEQLDSIGPVIGRGAVWMKEPVTVDTISDSYLFAGYQQRGLHLSHSGKDPWNVIIETGSPEGSWTKHSEVSVSGYAFVSFESKTPGEWIRLRSTNSANDACAAFTYRNQDSRTETADPIFDGLAKPGDTAGGGIVKARDKNVKTLSFASVTSDGNPGGYYELNADLKLKHIEDPETETFTRSHAAIPSGSLAVDNASVIFTDDDGKRWRLPKGDAAFDSPRFGGARIAREVATERDILNAHGTFYELPANNAGGIAKLRPVATHNRLIHDFCSYRGLLVLSGVSENAPESNEHIIHSDDGKTALWAGAIDDIWKLGKPRGRSGPWNQSQVKAGQASDPYLITGYDNKLLQIRFDDPKNDSLNITAQIDIHGDGTWVDYHKFFLENAHTTGHIFPESFSAYWIRFISDEDTTATATLIYK